MKLLMPADSNVLRFPPPRSTTVAYTGDEALLGPSAAIARVWSQIRRVAPHFRAAVVTGEPGSGAEVAARSLHALSPVCHLPFAILEAAHAESLFAVNSIHTVCEGLIFLPDVDKLSPVAQRGLVRKLRVRGRAPLRVVAATATELRASVSAGRFSAELGEILGAVRIVLPPLRERTEDIPLLVTQVGNRVAGHLSVLLPALAPSFHQAAAAFAWPGNLAQLEQLFSQLLQDHEGTTLTAEHFAAATVQAPEAPSLVPTPTRMLRLEDIVQEHIRAVLIACHGNKLRAAEILGISRSTLYRMLDGGVANPHLLLAV
jgi:DNA-binding NtrC family response regulator